MANNMSDIIWLKLIVNSLSWILSKGRPADIFIKISKHTVANRSHSGVNNFVHSEEGVGFHKMDAIRPRGHPSQRHIVHIPSDSHHGHVYTGSLQQCRLHHCILFPDVSSAICEDNGIVGNIRSVSIPGNESHCSCHLQATGQVGSSSLVADKSDGLVYIFLSGVTVKEETHLGVVVEGDQTDSDFSAPGFKMSGDVDEELLYHAESLMLDTARDVQHKHHIGLSPASWEIITICASS